MEYLAGFLGIIFFTGLLFVWSENKKGIKWKYPAILMGIMFAVAFIFTRTSFGIAVANGVATFFGWITNAAMNGITFVFGDLGNVGGKGAVFFFNVLMPIVLVSVLVGILLKLGVWGKVSSFIGKILSKVSGQDELLSYMSPNAFMLSQTGIFMSAREYIEKLSPRQIWSMALIGNGQISSTIIGSYLGMLTPKYVVTATILNMIVSLFAVNIVFPDDSSLEEENKFDTELLNKKPEGNILQVISDYATTGFQMIIAISVGLMAFLGIIALLNNAFDGAFGITFQEILGKVFSPIAWLMGAGSDSAQVGNLMATKFVANEFASILTMQGMHLTAHSTAIASTSVLSFANLSCIAIISGGIAAVSEKQRKVFLQKGFKIITVSFICSLITGTIVGLMTF